MYANFIFYKLHSNFTCCIQILHVAFQLHILHFRCCIEILHSAFKFYLLHPNFACCIQFLHVAFKLHLLRFTCCIQILHASFKFIDGFSNLYDVQTWTERRPSPDADSNQVLGVLLQGDSSRLERHSQPVFFALILGEHVSVGSWDL